jgi:hypothetical protein
LTPPVSLADRAQTKSEEIARPDLGALPPLVLRCSSGLSGLGPLALAGYVVETASGVPFPRYIDDNIFQPLGMKRSSFLLPPELAPDLATGYHYESGKHRPLRYYYMNVGPCGGLVTTAADMARFLIVHLHEGQYGETRILREETAREMHATQFRAYPGFDGMAYGFVESTRHGQRRLEHSGSIPGFQTLMRIAPGEDIGYLASVTSNDSGAWFLHDLFRELEDHYWPSTPATTMGTPAGVTGRDLGRYTGSYRSNIYSRSTSRKADLLFQPVEVTVTANSDGTLSTNAIFYHPPGRWVEVRPAVFQRIGSEEKMAFRADDRGRVTYMLMEPDAFEKVLWYERCPLHLAFIIICAALFSSACAIWPMAEVVRCFRHQRRTGNPSWRNAAALLGTVCTLNLIYPLLLGKVVDRYARDFGAGIPPVYAAVRGLAVAAGLATAIIPVAAVIALRGKYWSPISRVYYSVVAVAAVLWVPYLTYWNLLRFGA